MTRDTCVLVFFGLKGVIWLTPHLSVLSESGEIEQQLGLVRADLEASETRKTSQVKALDKTMKLLRQEKEDFQRVRAVFIHFGIKIIIFV